MPESKLPAGYRQGIITSITVFLGFCLAFLRFWGFETRPGWTGAGIIVFLLFLISLFMQIVALRRALLLKDENEKEYTKTVNIFMTAIGILMFSFVIAVLTFSTYG